MRKIAWVLSLPASTLADWDLGFDEELKPLKIPDNRGKASKVTPGVVRRVMEEAQKRKDRGKRIRLKQFTKELVEMGVALSSKTVGEILTANDLRAPGTRKRRPRYYQGLCRQIPNGVLGVDGSGITVWLDDLPIPLHIELAVDVGTFAHTAFGIGDTESGEEVLRVLEAHVKEWGPPLGFLSDHGSANLSGPVRDYLKSLDIEILTAGPANPKGNGSLEGAFSQLKEALGTIRLDTSSPRALAISVLEALVGLYVKMRNKLPLRRESGAPLENLATPVEPDRLEPERRRLKARGEAKERNGDQEKIDRIRFLIEDQGIRAEPLAVERAEKTIVHYETAAISAAEEAFVKAVNRKPERLSLPYFFGILKNVQKQRDDDAYKEHCRKKYNHQQMLERQRMAEQAEDEPTVGQILSMLEKGINAPARTVRKLALRKAREWTEELAKGKLYLGPLGKKLLDAIGTLSHLSIEKREQMWSFVQEFLNPKTGEECVTCSG